MHHPLEQVTLEDNIKAEAKHLGFPFCGICSADPPNHHAKFTSWLDNGNHADMHYLASARSRYMRADPKHLLPECQSIISLVTPYPSPNKEKVNHQSQGEIASYAWGKDYHLVIPQRLEQLVKFINTQLATPVIAKICVDTAPISERDYAQSAGLGWIGRNSCLIIPGFGSHFFLSEILVDIHLQPDVSFSADGCIACRQCIDACPTHAILSDRTIDARRCISYLTIENHNAIPENMRAPISNRIFGCDTCQQICPHNQSTTHANGIPEILEPEVTTHPYLSQALSLNQSQFEETYHNSPVLRAKYPGYLRNLLIAMGNHPSPIYNDPLVQFKNAHDWDAYPNYDLSQLLAWAQERNRQ